METKEITIANLKIGKNNPLVLIAGPCVIEDEESCLKTAKKIKEITQELSIPFIFKSSYDKANRSSVNSYRGPGLLKGLAVLKKIKSKLNLPIMTDVHCVNEVKKVAKVVDIIQIPAFLCRQTNLIMEVAKTKRVINVKKGQFLSPLETKNIILKITSTENNQILITERGTFFGYHNLVVDFRSIPIMQNFGYPVIFDATHSVQLPGGKGDCSAGEREFVKYLAKAAVAVGCDGLFLEVHPDPSQALCDGPNMINLEELYGLLKEVKALADLALSFYPSKDKRR
ncbi:3-deoxy-8-phosphooctulonate synthase [bacterium]|nr:3-deoxy-8-phosphooctulonate synthase [bacterium]MBU0899984.1 3-deoxy-8-phosphooctulonate synthase [bacterium]MBU1153744.1 3-deoxy-8-phosphooctulonate synthase [bacterium]MBU1782420.1 3-deoxy-8-phosphooctulonate synthase [bacterium]MBU2600375.1 3-deoxy-8-phosphooctulonate synthase [bacterium]